MFAGFLIVWLVLPGTGAAQMGAPTATRAFTEVGIDQKLNEQISLDIVFRDEGGNAVSLQKYFSGKPVIISLVYYRCPMLCTQVLNGMVETFRILQLSAGQDFEVVTVSIDPSEGAELAAEKKGHYIEAYERDGAEKGWHFLTGDQKSITALANAVGFKYVYDEATKQFAHASGIMVATPEGKVARYLYGIEYGAKDLTFSLMEASQNKIGSPVDKLLLLCYHYDPMTGTYGVVVANLLRGGAVVTLLVLGGFMYINFRRDRRKALAKA
jgi:protein SCO1/2